MGLPKATTICQVLRVSPWYNARNSVGTAFTVPSPESRAPTPGSLNMPYISNRRTFVKHAGLLLAGAQLAPWFKFVCAADLENAIADTSTGKVRGVVVDGVTVFKGIAYGAPTEGKNRFMPPGKPMAWTGTRDALAFGPTAPQTSDNSGTTAAGSPAQQSEDCLVLNVFTPGLNDGRKRPVKVWLHGGGFA